MSRYLVPLIFFAAAGYIWHYNGTHADSYLLVPFLDALGGLETQAEWSWRIMAGIGGVLLLYALGQDLMRRSPEPDSNSDSDSD